MNLLTNYMQYYIIPFLLFLTLFLIIIILLKRIRYEHNKPHREAISNKAETFLTEIILSNPKDKNFGAKLSIFKKEIPHHKVWCKEMIIKDMIRFRRSLKGKASEQINAFYEELGLDKYSAGLIRDYRIFYKCEGFYHFQALDYKEGIALIKPYLKHSNVVIRSNATMAYISLSENMEILIQQSTDITHLNMIKIMDILHEKKIPIPKNIDQWIETENNSVTKLGIKVMVFYNYRKQARGIIALIHNEDESLKKEAITAIRELYLIEAMADLKLLFDKASLEVQVEIIETLMVIGDKSIIPFLEHIIWTATNIDVKLKAGECRKEIEKIALGALVTNDYDITKVPNHVRELSL